MQASIVENNQLPVFCLLPRICQRDLDNGRSSADQVNLKSLLKSKCLDLTRERICYDQVLRDAIACRYYTTMHVATM